MCDPVFDGNRFWIVYSPTICLETNHRQIASLDSAREEAKRLSALHCGHKFYVSRVVGYAYTDKPTTPPTAYILLYKPRK